MFFMFFPTGSDKVLFGMPWFTIGTIAICVLVHVASWFGFNAIEAWGYQPAAGIGPNVLLCTLVHGGIMHLFGNMMFLWCMGINLETRWGTGPFAAVYVVGGIVATLAYTSLHLGSSIRLVGASGAISAAMGAFLISLYATKIRFAYVYWLFVKFGAGSFQIPAYVVLPLWFISDLLGARAESEGIASGVAYSAHVGGFAIGMGLAALMRFTGFEQKLMDQQGSDAWDNPDNWTELPQAPLTERTSPWKCRICNLVNEPTRVKCSRCRADP